MESIFRLRFKTTGKDVLSINVPFPDKTKSKEDISRAMDGILESNTILSSKGALIEKIDAQLIETEIREFSI